MVNPTRLGQPAVDRRWLPRPESRQSVRATVPVPIVPDPRRVGCRIVEGGVASFGSTVWPSVVSRAAPRAAVLAAAAAASPPAYVVAHGNTLERALPIAARSRSVRRPPRFALRPTSRGPADKCDSITGAGRRPAPRAREKDLRRSCFRVDGHDRSANPRRIGQRPGDAHGSPGRTLGVDSTSGGGGGASSATVMSSNIGGF